MTTLTLKPRLADLYDEMAPLYLHYDGQTDAQPAYVSLDLKTGEIDARANGEIGNAVPFSVWHRLVLRYCKPWLPTSSRCWSGSTRGARSGGTARITSGRSMTTLPTQRARSG